MNGGMRSLGPGEDDQSSPEARLGGNFPNFGATARFEAMGEPFTTPELRKCGRRLADLERLFADGAVPSPDVIAVSTQPPTRTLCDLQHPPLQPRATMQSLNVPPLRRVLPPLLGAPQ